MIIIESNRFSIVTLISDFRSVESLQVESNKSLRWKVSNNHETLNKLRRNKMPNKLPCVGSLYGRMLLYHTISRKHQNVSSNRCYHHHRCITITKNNNMSDDLVVVCCCGCGRCCCCLLLFNSCVARLICKKRFGGSCNKIKYSAVHVLADVCF